MSTLELKWRDREIGGAQTARRFLDFVIDGQSFYEEVGDLVSPFGWLAPVGSRKAADRFLLREDADFPNERRSIYVCPECADLGCGAVSAVIERIDNTVVWRDFGYENDYDENVHLEDYKNFGPFVFNLSDYERAIESALETNDEQSRTKQDHLFDGQGQ